jgi:hypothetical protein
MRTRLAAAAQPMFALIRKGAIMTSQYLPHDIETAPREHHSRVPTRSRRVYITLALLFWLGVIAQAFLAGAGMFVSGSLMAWHAALGHILTSPIPLIPLLLVILSFVARLPRSDKWLSALLLVLAALQPVVLYFRGVLPLLSALHPVNALLLFALPLWLVARVRRSMRSATEVKTLGATTLRTSTE